MKTREKYTVLFLLRAARVLQERFSGFGTEIKELAEKINASETEAE